MGIRRYLKKKPTQDRTCGRLENLAFVDVVQMMMMGSKTGCIILKHNERRGEAWFEKGRLRHAGGGGMAGEDAFCAMIGWETGEFEILHDVRANMPSMNCDPMALLMRGAKSLDEEAVQESDVKPAQEKPRTPGAWRRPGVIAPALFGIAGLITMWVVL